MKRKMPEFKGNIEGLYYEINNLNYGLQNLYDQRGKYEDDFRNQNVENKIEHIENRLKFLYMYSCENP